MKRVLGFLLSALVLAGIVWYEQLPEQTTTSYSYAEVEEHGPPVMPEPTDTTQTTATPTTAPAPAPSVDFSKPDLQLVIKGNDGDDVTISEVVGKARKLEALPEAVETEVRSCPGITERDMVVPIYSQIERLSALAVDVDVDYKTFEHIAVFEYDDGPACDDGKVRHGLKSGSTSRFTYWLVLSGAITPDHPDGDLEGVHVELSVPSVTLPHMEGMASEFSGARLLECDYSLGDVSKMLVVGTPSEDCVLQPTP